VLRDERGAVSVEYVTIVGTIGLMLIGSLVSLGPYLLLNYQVSRALLIGPFP
jgi:Flp pilus assembly pilin Flp